MTGIDEYVTALDHRLRGPRRLTSDILTEVRDGLCDATEAYRREGLTADAAERRAVAEFGGVDDLAGQFQRELGMVQGRRTALKLAAVMPLSVYLSGLAWHYLFPGALGARLVPPQDYLAAAQVVDVAGYGTGAFFLVVWLLLGPGARVLPMPGWVPRALGRVAAGLLSASMLAGLVLLVVSLSWAPEAALSTAMGVNAVVWTVCFTLAIRTTRRCLRAA